MTDNTEHDEWDDIVIPTIVPEKKTNRYRKRSQTCYCGRKTQKNIRGKCRNRKTQSIMEK